MLPPSPFTPTPRCPIHGQNTNNIIIIQYINQMALSSTNTYSMFTEIYLQVMQCFGTYSQETLRKCHNIPTLIEEIFLPQFIRMPLIPIQQYFKISIPFFISDDNKYYRTEPLQYLIQLLVLQHFSKQLLILYNRPPSQICQQICFLIVNIREEGWIIWK